MTKRDREAQINIEDRRGKEGKEKKKRKTEGHQKWESFHFCG